MQRRQEEGGGGEFVVQGVTAILLRLPQSYGHRRDEGRDEVGLHVGEEQPGDGRRALERNDDRERTDGVQQQGMNDGAHVAVEGLGRDEELVEFSFVLCEILITMMMIRMLIAVLVVVVVGRGDTTFLLVIIIIDVITIVVVSIMICGSCLFKLLLSTSLNVLRN